MTQHDIITALQHAAASLRQGANPASIARDLERLARDAAKAATAKRG